ncbi:MAG: molybdopterin cofactor-binding domain-containing protein, partial [Jatrophihabitantaceae bacterium]
MTTTQDRPDVAGEPTGEIGRSRKRKEDAHLITGRTTWTDNLTLPGMVHIAILRSPMAHARITAVDVSGALSRPGVLAAYSGRDFAEIQGSIPCAWPVTPEMVNPGHPSLAVDQVNHVGEAVAVVVARDKASAQDALEAVDVDYEQLPVVLDMERALAPDADLVHGHTESNRSFTWIFESGAAGTGAPIDDVLGQAEVTVSRRFVQQRLIPAFMEPRSTVVQPNGDGFTMWSSTQIPHILRTMLALTLDVPEHKVRVIAPDVGGGFGGKLQVTPEEVITALVARELGKPAKYTESRSESLMSGHHGRDQIQDITITARRDGTVTGLDVHL